MALLRGFRDVSCTAVEKQSCFGDLDEPNRAMTPGESSIRFVGSFLQEILKGQEDDWVPYSPTSQKFPCQQESWEEGAGLQL